MKGNLGFVAFRDLMSEEA